jgi:septum formation protein
MECTALNQPLLLASTSPYRRELLQKLRLPFEVCAPNVDEAALPQELPAQTATRLAQMKALALADHYPTHLIIGSDQVANFQGQALGKPGSHDKALAQLLSFRGQCVTFHTALCVWNGSTARTHEALVDTQVYFRHWSDAQLDAYLRLEQPYDCAGAAKSEGLGVALIERMQGDDPNALMGLPLIALVSILRELHYPFFALAAD